MTRWRTTSLVLALLTISLAAGCSGSSAGSAASGGSAGAGVSGASSAGSAASDRAPGVEIANGAAVAGGSTAGPAHAEADANNPGTAAGSGSSAADVAQSLTKQVRTAQLVIQVASADNALTDALNSVRSDATRFGGYVSDENTSFGSAPTPEPAPSLEPDVLPSTEPVTPGLITSESVITLRVPQARLDDALATVSRVGRVLERTTSVQDVTGSLADLTSRVSSERASLDRVRTLMGRATSLHDVVLLEGELSDRESDLESIQAQQRALSGQADLATVTITLHASTPTAVRPVQHSGFSGGLRHGWTGLRTTFRVVLVALGTVLPFTLVLAILSWPGYLVARRTRRILRNRRTTPDPPTPVNP